MRFTGDLVYTLPTDDQVPGILHDQTALNRDGGFIGSVLRYLLSGAAQSFSQSIAFPYGTLSVNILGCLCIGVLSELTENRGILSSDARAFLIVGILGGFTTFSAFGNETMSLIRSGEPALALINVGAHVVLGLGAVWLGYTLAYAIWR